MANANGGDLFLVTAVGSCFGQRIMFTHTYRLFNIDPDISVGLATATLLAKIRSGAAGSDGWETLYRELLPPQYELLYWRCQLIKPNRFVPVDFLRGVPGLHANDTEATNQAAVITLRTEKSGRKQVSNKHVGPLPQDVSVQVDGLLAATYKSKLQDLGDALCLNVLDITTGAEWNPVIWHRADDPLATDIVLAAIPQETIRVMRRRTVGLGI